MVFLLWKTQESVNGIACDLSHNRVTKLRDIIKYILDFNSIAQFSTLEIIKIMSELLLLVGYSNSGKDYIAERRYKNFTNVKLTKEFKQLFASDHSLDYEDCNDKAMRESVLSYGPMAGQTLSDAMVLCYNQSLMGVGYGGKFQYITITSTINTLANLAMTRTPVVITDLRKLTELKVLLSFAEVINYIPKMLIVRSNKSTPKDSDRSLEENRQLFEYLTGKKAEICLNDY
jgi:hypothetical protein